MSAHTPGPWQIHSEMDEFYIVGDIDGPLDNNELNYRGVCDVCEWPEGDAMNRANARLIAAAPELLAACKAALGAFEHHHAIDWNELQDAIVKAEGA